MESKATSASHVNMSRAQTNPPSSCHPGSAEHAAVKCCRMWLLVMAVALWPPSSRGVVLGSAMGFPLCSTSQPCAKAQAGMAGEERAVLHFHPVPSQAWGIPPSLTTHLHFSFRSTSSETALVTTRRCKYLGWPSILLHHPLPFQLPAPLDPAPSPCFFWLPHTCWHPVFMDLQVWPRDLSLCHSAAIQRFPRSPSSTSFPLSQRPWLGTDPRERSPYLEPCVLQGPAHLQLSPSLQGLCPASQGRCWRPQLT